MHSMNRFLAVAVTALIGLCSCNEPTGAGQKIFDLRRLEGRWESITDRAHRFEEWNADSTGGLAGKGFVLEGGDTTFIEFLSIHEQDGVLTYYAQVGDRHNTEVVPFRMGVQGADLIEFVNPGHDFPRRIVYHLHSDDSLHAFIEGPRDQGVYRINFDFVRSGR
jgi:hypothetical protein